MAAIFLSSIRAKIFLFYTLGLFVTLMFFNILVYQNYVENAERKIDALLGVKIQAVESAIQAYWETQAKVQEPEPGWFAELVGGAQKRTIPEDPYDVILRYLTDEGATTPSSEPKIAIDIFAPNGLFLDSTYLEKKKGILDPAVLKRVLAQGKISYSYSAATDKGDTIPVRAMAKAIKLDTHVRNVVQARVNVRSIQEELRSLMMKLLLRSLVVVLLASGGSFLLVQFTLHPVDLMTRTIRNIKPDNLHNRLKVPGTSDEIARLAVTFNTMLERVERSFNAQRRIAQDISHELRTPLTIVRGQMEVTLKKRRSAEEYEEILRSSLEEMVKIRRIIDNLLLLAEFDSQGPAMEMKTLDVQKLLQGIVEDIRVQGLERRLEVDFTPQGDVSVYGNEVHLGLLFRNLLENAVKYNREGGSIRVSARSKNGMAEVSIADTGIGISPEDAEKIFDRFYRVDPARSSGVGFGLGLSIARSIIEAHGGQVRVNSEPGLGTTFVVSLPTGAGNHFLAK